MKTRSKLMVLLVLSVAGLISNKCTKSSDNSTPVVKVKLATSPDLGQYLVDKDGYTLYIFANDYNGNVSCTGGCAAIWPPFYAGDITMGNLGSGLNLSDFDTIMVNGSPQTRYKGWPLYYYAPASGSYNTRETPGQTGGEGVGNIWFVAKPDYSISLVNTQLVGNDGKDYTGSYTEGTGKTLYFSDAKGVTLYTFSKDSFNMNKFTKSDFSNNSVWPIYESSLMAVPSTLDKSQFDSINVYGKMQLTYKGWPLYYFGADNGVRGSNKGISFPVPGIWPVAVKDMAGAPH